MHGQKVRRRIWCLFVNGLPTGRHRAQESADPNADYEKAYNQIQTYKGRHPVRRFLYNLPATSSRRLVAPLRFAQRRPESSPLALVGGAKGAKAAC